jgi:hypothetical protein
MNAPKASANQILYCDMVDVDYSDKINARSRQDWVSYYITQLWMPEDKANKYFDAMVAIGRLLQFREGISTIPLYTTQPRPSLSWQQRIENYVRETKYPRSLFIGEDERVVGTWIMGNSYQVKSTYYGGYPHGYLRRVKALFPDKQRVLHLFSGKVDTETFPGDTVDLNADNNPTYVDDAQTLTQVPLETYDLVLADPPYSVEDAEHYKTTMVKRNLVMQALGERLPVGAHVVWLDQVLPMYRKNQFHIDAAIGMVRSTNHRFRVITIFRRL